MCNVNNRTFLNSEVSMTVKITLLYFPTNETWSKILKFITYFNLLTGHSQCKARKKERKNERTKERKKGKRTLTYSYSSNPALKNKCIAFYNS